MLCHRVIGVSCHVLPSSNKVSHLLTFLTYIPLLCKIGTVFRKLLGDMGVNESEP